MSTQNGSPSDHDGLEMPSEGKPPPAEDKEQLVKRRTKTGCLTCRKRRIKCGEERPVCKNCIKSKRDCAGYSQPSYLKNPERVGIDVATGGVFNPSPMWSWQGTNFQSIDNFGSQRQLQYHQSAIPFSSVRNVADTNVVTRMVEDAVPTYSNAYQLLNGPVSSLTSPPQTPLNSMAHNYQHTITPSMTNNEVHPEWPKDPGTPWYSPESQFSPAYSPNQYTNLGFAQRSDLARSVSVTDIKAAGTGSLGEADDTDDPDDPFDIDMGPSGTQIDNGLLSSSSMSHIQSQQATDASHALISRHTSFTQSPLLEERSQGIFRHFLTVVGPCMSIFDRQDHSSNGIPPHVIWTNELPKMAFHNSALGHAILALSAIHMSKIGLCSEGVALKHFTYACRRIAKSVGNSHARLEVSTLATVLVLGYYEVMKGDHACWTLHLGGAAKLIMEHNYAAIIPGIRHAQTQLGASLGLGCRISGPDKTAHQVLLQWLNDDCWKVEEELISKLMGFEVNYNEQMQPNFICDATCVPLDHEKIKDWMTQMDLYWWYCKQDIFQSMLSGEPLLLRYSDWRYCPPRGPINSIETAHATMDHLWLLLARLTDFAAKDRKRKQKAVEAHGGQWIPAPGFMGSTPVRPSANEGRARTVRQAVQSPPPQQTTFFGMIPPPATEPRILPSFAAMNAQIINHLQASPESGNSSTGSTLEQQTEIAMAEHDSITRAFDCFESCLGPDFQPLSADDIQIITPFGSAIRYKSPTIAAMWTLFLVGKIVLRRVHPYSPPAAMMSAGVNADFTKDSAQLVGRICGGLFAQHSYLLQAGHVDHLLSGVVKEVTFSLLFAAIQFQDPIQRGWTIGKLSEIATDLGWQSSAAIAAACETTWETMGFSGKGPPYDRTLDQHNADDRVNGSYRYAYGLSPKAVASAIQKSGKDSRFISHDRDLIDRQAATRVHWALGLLSVEEDLKRMAVSGGE